MYSRLLACQCRTQHIDADNWNYITVDANGPKYVNASMIKSSLTLPPEMQMPEKTYIAAQGPLKTTIDDFWHTVDQMNVSVVVMLAKLVENQRVSARCGLILG